MYETDWSGPLQALTYNQIEKRLKAVLELCDEAQVWGVKNSEVLFFEKDIRDAAMGR